MSGRTSVIALYYSPWLADGLKRPSKSKPLAEYRYAVWYKANPRDAVRLEPLGLRT